MAVQAAAALLDELMGRYRNAAPTEKIKKCNWEDPEYCRYYMVKFCPHDLFVNTRSDLGVCPKVHDDEAKSQFEKMAGYRKVSYEDEFVRYAQTMLNEVERKITKGKQRLALMGTKAEPPSSMTNAQSQKNEEQINMLSEKINKLVAEAEAAGIEGSVEQAQGLMKLCDQLKEEREDLRKQNDNHAWSQTAELAAVQEKQMEVCEVCGAFLIVGDAQSRIDDHLMGKQHAGFAKLRAAVEEIMDARAKEREEKEKRREKEREERRAKEEIEKRERDVRGDRDRDRRYREEERRERDRESGRDRERERDRDRERERRERKDERRRSRDRSRDRERRSRHEDRHGRRAAEQLKLVQPKGQFASADDRDYERERERDRDRESERRDKRRD